MLLPQPDLVLRPITGPEELDLFNSLPYILNDEIGDDLPAGHRRPEWLWLALRADRVVARAGWWSRAHDRHPLLMDSFDLDALDGGDAGDGVRLLERALPAVVPAGATPPQYARFLPQTGATIRATGRRSRTGWVPWNGSEHGCSSNGCAWSGDLVRPSPNSAGG